MRYLSRPKFEFHDGHRSRQEKLMTHLNANFWQDAWSKRIYLSTLQKPYRKHITYMHWIKVAGLYKSGIILQFSFGPRTKNAIPKFQSVIEGRRFVDHLRFLSFNFEVTSLSFWIQRKPTVINQLTLGHSGMDFIKINKQYGKRGLVI